MHSSEILGFLKLEREIITEKITEGLSLKNIQVVSFLRGLEHRQPCRDP